MLVGRAPELDTLAAHIAERRAVVVVGEAGVGKTTLLRAAAAAAAPRVLEGGALSTLSWMEHLPLQRALGRPVMGRDAAAVAVDVARAVGPGVLIVDDLQWMDSRTAEVLPLLAGRVRLLGGVRRGDPDAGRVQDLLADAGFVELVVGALPPDESTSLVTALRPDLSASAVERLVARTGGNPLLLRELATTGEPSASLRLALAARLRGLDVPGREAFALLALAGRPLGVEELGREGAKSLLDADLALPDGPGIAVRHALLAEVAVEDMTQADKRAAHARLARIVAEPGEAARHHQLAGEPDRAHAAALGAARAATRPGERASHLAVAATCARGPEADALRLEAAQALGEAHDWAALMAVLDALTSTDPQTIATAALLRARMAWSAGDEAALRAALAEGLAAVGGTGSDVEVRLRIEQSRIPIFVDSEVDAGVVMARAALELAERTGVDVPRAHYFLGTGLTVADQPGAEAHLRAAIDGARASGDTQTEMAAGNNLIGHYGMSVSPEPARALAVELAERARELGLRYWETSMRVNLANVDFHAGRYHAVVDETDALLADPIDARSRDILVETAGMALVDLGHSDEAARRVSAHLEVAIPDYAGQTSMVWVLAEAALWGGRPEDALRLITEYLAGPPEVNPNLAFGYVTRAWALVELGRDPGARARAHERPIVRGAPDETEALGHLHRGDHDGAATLFARAAALWDPLHVRGVVRCRWAEGEALRRAGRIEEAVARLSAVEVTAAEQQAAPMLARIHRSLRAAGVRRSAVRGDAPSGLTTREHEVLLLVAEGLTNDQIAGRLGVSRRTIVAQISSAAAKLGATGRVQAAAIVVRGQG